ncbi:MAG TPA: hypothetical protein VM889_05610, partial [Candidatus Thermoplasmatota archaeon]|nr:hypothetical protein [Candidatus Thermoplasmatota archaeon]
MSVETDVNDPAGADGDRRLAREVAQRVFAAEFGPSTLEFKEGGERSPSYVVTPLGARVNRLLVVGVLTSKENVGQGGDMWRAQIHDPTGTFNVYAGQYQPEAAAALAEIKPPAVVAVVGKSRTYSPEGGVVYTSIRPESIRVVDVGERDRWIVETAKHTLHRIGAVREAKRAGGAPSAKTLEDLGYAPDLADGVVRALGHYTEGDEVRRIATAVKDALETVLPGASNAMAAGFAPATSYAP